MYYNLNGRWSEHMKPFKRAIIYQKRQPIKNFILFILIFTLGTVLSGAISVRQAIIATEEAVMMRVPAISTIDFDQVAAAEELEVSIWELPPGIDGLGRPTIEEIIAIGNIDYVRDFDFYFIGELWSEKFHWVVPDIDESRIRGALTRLQEVISGEHYFGGIFEIFPIRGVLNHELIDIEAGLIELISGRTFTVNEIDSGAMVVLISQEFAILNDLYVGSTISFDSIVLNTYEMLQENMADHSFDWDKARGEERFRMHHEIFEFKVIGIFEVIHEIIYENYVGQELELKLREFAEMHNRVYMPVTVADEIINAERAVRVEIYELWEASSIDINATSYLYEAWGEGVFVLYDSRDLSAFTNLAVEMLPGFWTVRDLTGGFATTIASMDTILELADLVLILAIGATFLVLTLTIALILHERRKEIGLYMALGDKRSKIISQFLIELFIISSFGITGSLFVGNLLSGEISRNMLEESVLAQIEESQNARWNIDQIPSSIRIFTPDDLSLEELFEMYDTSLGIETIAIFTGLSVLIIVISTIIPVVQILKINPKKILLG